MGQDIRSLPDAVSFRSPVIGEAATRRSWTFAGPLDSTPAQSLTTDLR